MHPPAAGRFPTTLWEVVLLARGGEGEASREALGALCGRYWRPVYGYVRSRGNGVEESRDLTQEFFAHFIEGDFLKGVQQDRGRFRTFLAVCVKRFLANEYDRKTALKRGGGSVPLSLDCTDAEHQLTKLPQNGLSADERFDQQWAYTLLEGVLATLRAEYAAKRNGVRFEVLREFLTLGRGEESYAAAAEALGTSEGAVRVAVHRLRRRFRDLLRAEVLELVADPADIDDELRVLRSILSP